MEAVTLSEDSENRIVIGGKRKSSSRRSSILKATKSPIKPGVLEDLDPNTLDDNGRSKSKKSRRSSGRRVSFAEKNDIKEFFVEDWKSAWAKDAEKNNLQVPSSASQGEYRDPAESIQGLESLLKGDIQADDGQVRKVEIQEMPEVQYSQLSEANQHSAVTYDRGILLQTITQDHTQHTLPLDVTDCHGPGIIGASHISREISSTNPSEQAEEMEYTKCHSSLLPLSTSTKGDQKESFSDDTTIELDVTCTQQEISFRDYPDAQLSSPGSLEENGKMDSRSFLMSLELKPLCTQTDEVTHTKDFSTPTGISNAYLKRRPLGEITAAQISMKSKHSDGALNGTQPVPESTFDENVELTACHSYKILDSSIQKTKRRSIYESADIDVTSCYGPGLMKSLDNHGPDQVSGRRSQTSGVTTDLNASRNSFETESLPECTAQLDITNCYGDGILSGKPLLALGADQTVFTTNSTDSLDLTECQVQEGQDITGSPLQSCQNELACNGSMFLRSLGTGKNSIAATSSDEIEGEMDLTESHGSTLYSKINNYFTSGHKAKGPENVSVLRSQTSGATTNSNADRNSFETDYRVHQHPAHADKLDITGSLDFTVFKTQQGQVAVSPFSTSPSQNCPNDHELSCNGSSRMDSSLFLRSLCEERHSSNTSHDESDLELTVCHGKPILDNSTQKANQRSLYEPADIDVTSCYGPGLVKSSGENLELTGCHGQEVLDNSRSQETNRRSIYEPADIDVTSCYGPGLVKSSGENLVLTGCHGQEVLDNSRSQQTNRRSLYEPADIDVTSCYGSGLVKSSGDNLELTVCHGQEVLDNSRSQQTNRRSLCEPADIDVTSCYGSGLVKSSGDNLELTVCHGKPVLDNSMSQKTNRRSLYEPADIDVTSCHGPGLIKSSGENLELTGCHGKPVLDNSMSQKANRRSLYEPADIDVTSCHGPGLVKSSGDNLELTVCQSQQVLDNSMSQKTNRRSLYEPADIDVTSCHGPGLIKSSGENLELTGCHGKPVLDNSMSQKANRRSLYEPADIDVTSCHGPGLVKSSGENLELTGCHGKPILDNSMSQKTNRRSLYEPADIDVTSCHGPGLVKSSGENLELTVCQSQQVLDNSRSQQTNRRSLYEPADIDVTSCYGSGLVKSSGDNLELTVCQSQQVLDNNTQQANQRSLYEPADIDTTSCHGPGLVKSSGDNLELTVCHGQEVLDNSMSQKTNWRSLYVPADIDVTSCHGPGLVKSSGENLELTGCHGKPILDNSVSQKTNRRSLYEPADIDVTSCYGPGLVKSSGENLELTVCQSQQVLDNSMSQKTNRRSLYEPADILTSCYGPGLVKSSGDNLELTVCHGQEILDSSTQKTNWRSLYEPADIDVTSCHGAGQIETPDEQVTSNNISEIPLNLLKSPETTFQRLHDSATSDKAEDLHGPVEVLHTSESCQLIQMQDNQVAGADHDRKLSIICEESVNEPSKKETTEDANVTEVEEMQNSTQSPITLKEFLDIAEIAFITEVNMRRSIAPSNAVEAPQTPKDMIISSLVSKPKATGYEEAIPVIESQITVMKEKVEQQEMELNVSNPRVFMEAQSASKEELLVMQSKVRRLRSVCEKTTKREWKEGKGQLNKKILTKITENHQALAGDVHTVEESLAMVDDCFNLLDKMDKDVDEEIKGIHLFLEGVKRNFRSKTSMVEELETMTEALRTSEQELADLECARSTLQSEKQELASRKEQLDGMVLENEEAIYLLKHKVPRSGSAATREMSQKLDILESLQEWSLEEWNKECAKFTFLKSTLEMLVLFGSETTDTESSSFNQEVISVQLCYTPAEQFRGKMGKVHTLVKQSVNQDILTQMCSSKKDLTKVLEHMSGIIYKSKEIGDELFRIGLSHLMSFKENRFVVEFSSLKAFVKFVLHIQLELQSYPDSVTFTVSPIIGHYSQTEIKETLNTVNAGPWYLSRLVEAADQLLIKSKPNPL
ncbi:protein localization to kinetochore [Desmophyllum pertusum]|uniref:Protein localization to kinetochore n=1 Tax=Desmophyllum pertusum TaxID=174260 RepID=A0A9W9ZG42_9CNID|nr:protein localization to kinetochore [Desmophyllum pertusum]